MNHDGEGQTVYLDENYVPIPVKDKDKAMFVTEFKDGKLITRLTTRKPTVDERLNALESRLKHD